MSKPGLEARRLALEALLQTEKGAFAGDKVEVACGGPAQPALGSDGSG